MRKRDKLRTYIILMLSIVTTIFVLSKIFPSNSINNNNYYDDVTIEDTSKLAYSSNNKHYVAAEMLIPTMQTHTHNNTKYCYV